MRAKPAINQMTSLLCWALLITLGLNQVVNCKSIKRAPVAEDLIAIPSEPEYNSAQPEAQQDEREKQDHYMIEEQQDSHQQDPSNGRQVHEQYQQAVREEVYYMLPNGQTIEASEYHRLNGGQGPEEDTRSGQHTPAAAAAVAQTNASYEINGHGQENAHQLGYIGEIVYANQDGEIYRQEQPANVYEKSAQLVDMTGKPLGGSPATMSATILTEVPLRDMPEHVLEQLKREFGAKVIATREYPGANLVINCGSPSGQDLNLCSGQRQVAEAGFIASQAPTSTTIQESTEPVHPTTPVMGVDSEEAPEDQEKASSPYPAGVDNTESSHTDEEYPQVDGHQTESIDEGASTDVVKSSSIAKKATDSDQKVRPKKD